MASEPSRPPSPLSHPDSPNLFPMGYLSSLSLDRLVRDEGSEYANAFTLLDTLETFWDSRMDLLQRNISRRKDNLKMRAELALNDIFKGKHPSPDVLAENFEREVAKLRLKVSTRMASLGAAWQSAKVVRTREKISFFFGVMSLVFSALLFGLAPQYVHMSYTIQLLYLLPYRYYSYKKLQWHYFLFDLCYFVNILNFIFLWILPQSPSLFVACYCLSHGAVASAVITWRNSLVFHDADKVTSLFIHVYPPFTFTVIRHFYPGADERFPALKELPHLHPWRALLLSSIIYLVWQLLYWKLVYVDRRKKVESGQRTTSLYWIINKPGLIGSLLSKFQPEDRALYFMLGQFDVPPVFVLYDSPFWSGAYLLFILSVSVWNGGGFYIEVFGRKFERELEALRKELAEAQSKSQRSSPTMDPSEGSEPVSPLLVTKPLAGEADTNPVVPAADSVGLSLRLEEAKKDQ
ncbi:hypothetical protein B0F90DRAFT_1810670 [Multifurca ochricompacta]|uniref:Glycerophosphocholine acyltransferase 1 n=1 Tax=Multifurca ochricompacta TaxID=376703 RepID=A0AAD4M2E7_9AGAM|nr:hypothetical protein B0F90DRAFT_1810670 [Multifurca ochricompacta]